MIAQPVSRCLVRRPHYFARLMRLRTHGPPRVRHRNALTEIAWEDAVQDLGLAMSTVASEENREMFFIANVFNKL